MCREKSDIRYNPSVRFFDIGESNRNLERVERTGGCVSLELTSNPIRKTWKVYMHNAYRNIAEKQAGKVMAITAFDSLPTRCPFVPIFIPPLCSSSCVAIYYNTNHSGRLSRTDTGTDSTVTVYYASSHQVACKRTKKESPREISSSATRIKTENRGRKNPGNTITKF